MVNNKIVKINGKVKRGNRWHTFDDIGLVVATSKYGYLVRLQIQPEPDVEYSRSKYWVRFNMCVEMEGK